MKRLTTLLYGIVCYLVFFGTFLLAIAFVENMFLPKGLDSPPVSTSSHAVVIDLLLLGVFAIQHSVMARQGFKKVWTQIVPPAVERSTFVLFSSFALLLLFFKWEPLGGTIWNVSDGPLKTALLGLSLLGWLIVLVSTFLVNHFDLFGLRQVFAYFMGRKLEPLAFSTVGFYRYVRHPIYLGFIIAFWATPTMTAAHLLFAVATTGYIFVGVSLEERDLLDYYGDVYRAYKDRVSMIFPLPPRD